MRRSTEAATILFRLLADDPQALAAFQTWCVFRGLTPQRLRHFRQAGGVQHPEFLAALQQMGPEEVAGLRLFARDGLHLPFAWVPAMLLDTFRLWASNIVRGEPRHTLVLEPDEAARRSLSRGRSPRRTLERDVIWYYRARVKTPSDPIKTIAAEYEKNDPAVRADPHTTVSEAIARVHDWFSQLRRDRPRTH